MRTKYCIRYELGLCPRHKGSGHKDIDLRRIKIDYPLMLENNGRRFVLGFDCGRCEMTVKEKNGQHDARLTLQLHLYGRITD